jgi:xanthine dehydrogenase YagS FAD-binding subunit
MRAFDCIDARSAQEAVDLLTTHGKRAQLFASGADVLFMLKDAIEGPMETPPDVLVNLGKVPELAEMRYDPATGLALGAMTRLIDLIEHPIIQEQYNLLVQAASQVASPQLRHTSTIAGNLCQRPRCWYFRHRDIVCLKKGGSTCWAVDGDNRYYHAILDGGPCYIVHPSDMAPALIALAAQIHILGPKGSRTLPLEEFFVTPVQRLYQENVLEREEVITALTVPPVPPETKQVFLKSRVRQADEFALTAVALAAQVKDGTCLNCRVVLGGVSPRPHRAMAAEQAITGKPLTAANVDQAATVALADARPMTMNAYKLDLTRGLVRRAFEHLQRV